MTNPIVPVLFALDHDFRTVLVGRSSTGFVHLLIFPMLTSVCLVVRAALHFRKPLRRPGNSWLRRTIRHFAPASSEVAAGYRRRIARGARLRDSVNPLAWRARVSQGYVQDDTWVRIQLGLWVFFVFVLLLKVAAGGLYNDRSGNSVRWLCWWSCLFVSIPTAIVAANSFISERNNGFLDQIIMTPMTANEIVAGTNWSIWWHVAPTVALAPTALLLLRLSSEVYFVNLIVFSVTFALWLLLLMHTGAACSLISRSLPGPLLMTLLLPVLMQVYSRFVPDQRMVKTLDVLLATALALGATTVVVRFLPTAISLGLHILAVHFALVTLATRWTPILVDGVRSTAGTKPGYWLSEVVGFLDIEWTRNHWLSLIGYWTALALNIVWLRIWMAKNFDRFVRGK